MSELDRSPSLRTMLGVGSNMLRRYTGLAVTVYLIQLALSLMAAWAMAHVLAGAYEHRPLFDSAVSGDAIALIMALRTESWVVPSLAWIGIAAVTIYMLLSWFLQGGLIAVFIDHPNTRRDVAQAFGAGGGATLFPFARLALISLIPYGLVFFAAVFGLSTIPDNTWIEAQTLTQVVMAMAPRLVPAALLYWFFGAAIDYARIDLSRHPELGSFRAFLRGIAFVATRIKPLLHIGIYYVAIGAITLGFVAATFDRSLPGAGGALTIFLLRQVTSASRFACRYALIAGQTEMSQLTVFPPKPRESRKERKLRKARERANKD
jgi:hypothetical protein